jgi:hypothetical protein
VSDAPVPRCPAPGTLRKYGLTEEEWWVLFHRQGGVCGVCGKLPANGRLCTDHDHVKGWKKLAPAERRRHVRGLLCWWCNGKLVGWRMTVEKAEACAKYLRGHRERLAADKLPEGLWG